VAVAVSRSAPVEALLFDLNGTLSHDEEFLFEVYAAMFESRGVELTRVDYVANLAGKSDEEMFVSRLGEDVDVAALVRERVDRYIELVGDGSSVSPEVRAAVAVAASRVRVGIVTSAWRDEVEAVLRGARLDGLVSVLIVADDVSQLKPSPEPYALACKRLSLASSRVLAVEDTDIGIASAQAAGLRCAGLTTTMPAERLASADLLLDALDRDAIDLLLRG
jgi:beta-phosphoglucomutase-like phosphatase (HAD superfamily)